MKKCFLSILMLFVIQANFAQYSKLWKGYFSYNEIKDLSVSSDKVVAAAENALFSQDLVTGSVVTTNTVDGLSGQTITAIYRSPGFKKTLVGYDNGLMIVINDTDGSMLNIVDIINKALPPTIKRINHFMEHNGIVYVSCDFGIVQFNLATLLFGDTYFIGNGGSQISVRQTAIFQDRIYAATFTNGMRSASTTNPNLNDFNQWTTLDSNGWTGVETFGTNLMAVSNTGYLYNWSGTTFGNPISLLEPSKDLRAGTDYLVVTTENHVYVYNMALSQVRNLSNSEITDASVKFSCAAIVNDKLYIGTQQHGLYTTSLLPSPFKNVSPGGTLINKVFAISSVNKSLWAVYGGYDKDYNPYTYYINGIAPAQMGISKFSDTGWLHIPYDDVLGAKSLSHITINPVNENQVYISSFFSGMLKVENNIPTILYNTSNTGTDGLKPVGGGTGTDNILVNGAAFDKDGNLWMNSSIQSKALVELQANGQWKSYDLSSVALNVGRFRFGRMAIDKNGTKWMATWRDGVVGFNEKYNNRVKKINDNLDEGNLPSFESKAVAIDHNNQLWIGTISGLRIMNVDSFLADAPLKTEAIIFKEFIDGQLVDQELLYQLSISDIVVDGANNKWIGTVDSGVYLVSPNGQQTFYHFTTDNSPLPSNNVLDVEVNTTTGEVFFATEKGMVSFKGTATGGSGNLNNVYVYPNPVRPDFLGTVKVSGLMDKAHVKIADITGNLVYEAISEGGTIEWDTTAFSKYKVASGVYMVFVSSEDGAETKVKKIMIIR